MDRTYEDSEIVMHAFRLLRSGNYARLPSLRKALLEDFPNEPKERIEACLRQLALRLSGEMQ